jgi:chemotaxis protein methyltransferase CheR
VARKLDLRLDETDTRSYTEYLGYLKSHPGEIDNLIKALTIKVSNFFRNPLVFELLRSRVLPALLSEFGTLRIWSLGCATGEEPYSVAVILKELLAKERDTFRVEILGTDIDAEAVRKAVAGEYSGDELLEVKKKHLDASFHRVPPTDQHHAGQKPRYGVNEEIKSMVRFEPGDIVAALRQRERAKGAFHLILCRNVLIYMNRALQQKIVGDIADIIAPNGYFIIGESETIPETSRNAFAQVFPGVKIYRKTTGADSP